MKQKIKLILKKIPGIKSVYLFVNRLIPESWRMRKMFVYDRNRYLTFQQAPDMDSQEGALARIIFCYHNIEKGLTMPNMRLGFGVAVMKRLISLLNTFADTYGAGAPQFVEAVRIVAEYKKVHDDAGFELDVERARAIVALLDRFPFEPSQQIEMTRERYWANLDAPFEVFSGLRHSVRNFAGTISVDQIRSAVALANNAPSACNRQPCKVHCISDKKTIQACLSIQGGNRGFGHLADKLLVLTADLRSAVWKEERNDIFTNAGIYLMNLCYALHKNKVAHCMLNWSTPPPCDRSLRQILSLPDAETVIVLIACGDVPEKFKLASSPRKSAEETLVLH